MSQSHYAALLSANYSIVVEGETVTWTGQGRMPTVFKQQIENGRGIEDFLI